jgi:hypothetical protein
VPSKLAEKGRISFDANVSGTDGRPHQGGLGGDCKKPGKGATGVALHYHKFHEYKDLPKDQQKELTEWNRANGGKKGKGGKGGKCATPGGNPRNTDKSTHYNKKF